MNELQEMLEHYRITKLINEYCHGCDRMDETRMASVYAQDSWDDHGTWKMPGRDFAKTVMAVRSQRQDIMSHQLGQSLVKIDGDRAGAETYFVATVRWSDKDGTAVLDQLGGRYVDQLVRENGKWKIQNRLTVRDWSITHQVTRDRIATLDFVAGQTGEEDPSFTVLGIRHSGDPNLT